jgi:hypothetical protein
MTGGELATVGDDVDGEVVLDGIGDFGKAGDDWLLFSSSLTTPVWTWAGGGAYKSAVKKSDAGTLLPLADLLSPPPMLLTAFWPSTSPPTPAAPAPVAPRCLSALAGRADEYPSSPSESSSSDECARLGILATHGGRSHSLPPAYSAALNLTQSSCHQD